MEILKQNCFQIEVIKQKSQNINVAAGLFKQNIFK